MTNAQTITGAVLAGLGIVAVTVLSATGHLSGEAATGLIGAVVGGGGGLAIGRTQPPKAA